MARPMQVSAPWASGSGRRQQDRGALGQLQDLVGAGARITGLVARHKEKIRETEYLEADLAGTEALLDFDQQFAGQDPEVYLRESNTLIDGMVGKVEDEEVATRLRKSMLVQREVNLRDDRRKWSEMEAARMRNVGERTMNGWLPAAEQIGEAFASGDPDRWEEGAALAESWQGKMRMALSGKPPVVQAAMMEEASKDASKMWMAAMLRRAPSVHRMADMFRTGKDTFTLKDGTEFNISGALTMAEQEALFDAELQRRNDAHAEMKQARAAITARDEALAEDIVNGYVVNLIEGSPMSWALDSLERDASTMPVGVAAKVRSALTTFSTGTQTLLNDDWRATQYGHLLENQVTYAPDKQFVLDRQKEAIQGVRKELLSVEQAKPVLKAVETHLQKMADLEEAGPDAVEVWEAMNSSRNAAISAGNMRVMHLAPEMEGILDAIRDPAKGADAQQRRGFAVEDQIRKSYEAAWNATNGMAGPLMEPMVYEAQKTAYGEILINKEEPSLSRIERMFKKLQPPGALERIARSTPAAVADQFPLLFGAKSQYVFREDGSVHIARTKVKWKSRGTSDEQNNAWRLALLLNSFPGLAASGAPQVDNSILSSEGARQAGVSNRPPAVVAPVSFGMGNPDKRGAR